VGVGVALLDLRAFFYLDIGFCGAQDRSLVPFVPPVDACRTLPATEPCLWDRTSYTFLGTALRTGKVREMFERKRGTVAELDQGRVCVTSRTWAFVAG
jgi:hypothetical protein